MIQGVIFDMDGLMFDSERVWDRLWIPCCEQMGLPAPTEEFLSAGRGTTGDRLKRHIHEFYPTVDPQKMLETMWKLGDVEFAKGVPVKPGLYELLDYLEEQGIPRIVASSSPKNMILCNLQTSNTMRYFHEVVSGLEVARSKPAPDIFLEAARRLGIEPAQCLVLEDSYNGVRAGVAAGMTTVMVPDMLPPTEEMAGLYTACCKDLREVRDLLAEGQR